MRSPDPGNLFIASALATMLDNLAIHGDNEIVSVGTPPNMAQGTGTATSFKSSNTVLYLSKGLVKSKASFEVAGTAGNASFTGAHDVTPDANTVQERTFVVYLDGAGNPTVIAGPQATGAGKSLYPDMPSVAPAAAGGPEGSQVGAGYPTSQANATYPAGVDATPIGLRTAGLTPIGGCIIAVAAGASGFRMGTTNPATAGAITATYFDGYPTAQILTTQ